MDWLSLFVAALFLPLFPLGMVFNRLFQQLTQAWLRAVLLIVWPLAGLAVMQAMAVTVTDGLATWALFSAALYGFRAVVIRDVCMWTGFLATSAWSLVWVARSAGMSFEALAVHVLAFSLPLVLLVFLIAELEKRYESAYAGVINGLARMQPRLSGVIVITLLAAIGSPLFPGFFVMLNDITLAVMSRPLIAIGIATVWLLWSWSGIRLLQELTIGDGLISAHGDIARGMTLVYSLLLLGIILGGVAVSGVSL